MTRAIRMHQTGGPEVLQMEEVTVPSPGRGQVKIRHHAIGLNFIEVYFRKGAYPAELPFTPGMSCIIWSTPAFIPVDALTPDPYMLPCAAWQRENGESHRRCEVKER